MNRRSFLGTAVAASTIGLNPLGLFRSKAFGSGSLPAGDYQQSLRDDQFWFQYLLKSEVVKERADTSKPGVLSNEKNQLCMRLGRSGGFAIGYFSTLSFLSDYKEQKPDEFRDLIINTAGLPPEIPGRKQQVLDQIAIHRRLADLPMKGNFTKDIKPKSANKTNSAPSSETSFMRNLEQLDVANIKSKLMGVVGETKKGNSELMQRIDKSFDVPVWAGVNDKVQKAAFDEFYLVNNFLETRIDSINIDPLLPDPTTKMVDLKWINQNVLTNSFPDGIDDGKLAAISYIAFSDADSTLAESTAQRFWKDGKPSVEQLDDALKAFGYANTVANGFAGPDYMNFGFDSGAFRPAVRLMLLCSMTTSAGDPQRIEIITPFMPYNLQHGLNQQQLGLTNEATSGFLSVAANRFSKPQESRYDLPKTTLYLEDGAIAGCASVLRHTSRLLRTVALDDATLADARLDSILIVPELTSPWTFSGVAAALCNTMLSTIGGGSLATAAGRRLFRDGVDRSVDDLLYRSVNRIAETDKTESSSSSPSMIQFASGYRAARVFGDYMAEQAAQADGARTVYGNLVRSMPEFFTPLPDKDFLTAEQIANTVLTIGNGVQTEIASLRQDVFSIRGKLDQATSENERLKVEISNLQAKLEEQKGYTANIGNMITQLQTELLKVTNMEQLTEFQKTQGAMLQDKLKTTTDAIQIAAISSLNGLVNTIATVAVAIRVNVQMSIKANAGCGNINKN